MRAFVVASFLAGLVCVSVEGAGKCSGSPKRYNGKMCASTTHYEDYHKGACGCGPASGDNQFQWNHNGFNTAPNQAFFDAAGGSWCGQNCGKCVRLTTTGGWVDGQGGHVSEGQSHVFMVTNLCPNVYPNTRWCSQSASNGFKNQDGYHNHFDLENGAGQLSAIGWADKNPEVTWEFADCTAAHNADGRTASDAMYHSCQCSGHGK
ncbi:endoglucanase-like [Mya arenaria]|uniref:endoglucanase-like n=1 Tax=Mya arenaria TaxID=6604 RepID=UPI0022E1CE90|nr:endoglucanase-like [Mya arenaria]